jgi:hypothetical protein
MKSGRTAPPEEGTETDPEQNWVPKELGRNPQRDNPLCSSGTTQKFVHKEDPGFSCIPKEFGHRLERDDPPCESGTAETE